jgi:hypothetical protein
MSTINTTVRDVPLMRHRDTVLVFPADEDDFVLKFETATRALTYQLVPDLNAVKDETNIVIGELNALKDIVVDKEVLVSDNAIIATEKAAEATLRASEATLRAFEASSDAFILAAYANIDYSSFDVLAGELIVTYTNLSISTPSLVDGEFILTY